MSDYFSLMYRVIVLSCAFVLLPGPTLHTSNSYDRLFVLKMHQLTNHQPTPFIIRE